MLIELPDSLINPANNPNESGDVIQLVNDLMTHVLKKDHEVHFGFQFLEWIIPKFIYMEKLRSLLEYYRDNWSTSPIPDFITEYIRIIPLEETEGTENINNKKVHRIHYTHFLKGEPFSSCKLVCENDNDFQFYSYIAAWKQQTSGFNYRISLSSFPGGGVTTSDNFQNSINRNHFSLCIVDSDKRWPNCKKVGDTAKKCGQVKASSTVQYHRLLILSCMEAENLIPIEAISNIQYTGDVEQRRNLLIGKFKNMDQMVLNQIYPHFDLKEGFKKNAQFLAKPKYYNFLNCCFDLIHPTVNFQDTVNATEEKNNIICGIKGDILDKSITWMKNISYSNWNQSTLLPFQYSEWSSLGTALTNFGFCPSHESMNY